MFSDLPRNFHEPFENHSKTFEEVSRDLPRSVKRTYQKCSGTMPDVFRNVSKSVKGWRTQEHSNKRFGTFLKVFRSLYKHAKRPSQKYSMIFSPQVLRDLTLSIQGCSKDCSETFSSFFFQGSLQKHWRTSNNIGKLPWTQAWAWRTIEFSNKKKRFFSIFSIASALCFSPALLII